MKVILLGAPGAGKGTQAELLSKRLNVPVIGTGNIIREAIRSGSTLGQRFRSYTDSGKLVPDELVVELVAERLRSDDCEGGYILDGFPRTIAQAEAFERMAGQIDAALNFELDDAVIVARMEGRRICARCGLPFHVEHNPPKVAGVCDACGGELQQRIDDKPETVRQRLAIYHEQTKPLEDFYRERGKLCALDATQSVEAVTRQAVDCLEGA